MTGNLGDYWDVLKAKLGDTEAFGAIYQRHFPEIYRFVLPKLRTKELAEDLASQAFLQAWEYLVEDGVAVENLRALLYRIARNLVIDHYRSKQREELPLEYAEGAVEASNPRDELEAAADRSLAQRLIQSAWLKLRPDYQEIISLRYWQDLSTREIAGVLERSEGSVRVMLHRALEELERLISEHGSKSPQPPLGEGGRQAN